MFGVAQPVNVVVTLENERHEPIAHELVKVMLHDPAVKEEPVILSGNTDLNGEYSCSGNSRSYVKVIAGGKSSKYALTRGKQVVRENVTDVQIRLMMYEHFEELDFASGELRWKVKKFGKEMGFDFVIGDFVAPEGTGKVADVYLTVTESGIGADAVPQYMDVTLRMNDRDGVGMITLQRQSLRKHPFGCQLPAKGWKNLTHWYWDRRGGTMSDFSLKSSEFLLCRIRPRKSGGKIDYSYAIVYYEKLGYNRGWKVGDFFMDYYLIPSKGASRLFLKDQEISLAEAAKLM